ncbi:MAG: MopE-related protein [bacterium]
MDGRWGACDGPPPGAAETCDGADEDGDGAVDEGLVEPCGRATGACEPGLRICVDGTWSACAGAVEPRPESCDGTDEDCDGAVDEAPIMATTGSMPAPTTRPPSSIAWDGRAYAVAMPGYPNWILRLAVLDAYVWRADLVGRVPVDAIVASGPSGLVVTWAERDGSVVFGRLGWGDDGLPIEPVTLRGEGEGGRASGLRIAAETRTTLLGWLDDREGTAMPWVVPIDPETGVPRREPLRIAETLAARGLSLANNGEDGFALGWVTDEGAWFARLSNTMEVASGPWRVAEGATAVAVAGDYYVDTFIAVWTDGEAVHLGRIARDTEVIGSTERVAEGQREVADLRFIRDDAKWGVFWTAAVEGGRVIRGRLYHRDGRTLSPVVDLGPVGEGAAVTFGIDGFTTATLTGGRLALRAGPIACPDE